MIDEIYNKEVLRLAANISRVEPLDRPDAYASLRAPLCGSTIDVGLQMNSGYITAFGQAIRACALGQAAASVLAEQVIGKSADDIQLARDQLAAMLMENGPVPEGDWSALSALLPARNARSRHGAILLPFDAVLKCFQS